MAVKEKTSKKAPTKFEDKDLQTLRDLQGQTDKIVYSLGQISVQRERLNMSENQLKEELKKIDQKEAELGKEFATKYGVGNVDIETGNFTPAS
jgi:hypothetical protein|tara:strand:- start:527 stop:805 length:279 start_codon:yes stop_codon:yes gene_type:complete